MQEVSEYSIVESKRETGNKMATINLIDVEFAMLSMVHFSYWMEM